MHIRTYMHYILALPIFAHSAIFSGSMYCCKLLQSLLNILICFVDDQLMMIFLSLAIGDMSEQVGGQTQLTCDGAKAAGETEKKEGEITGGKAVIALEALS